MADGGKSKLAASAARNLGTNPIRFLPRNVKTLTTAVGGLLSLSRLISPGIPNAHSSTELSLLNLAEPVIAQANPGSDLSFNLEKAESGESFDDFSFFAEAASALLPLATGFRRRTRSASSSSSSSSSSDRADSNGFNVDTSSALRHIYFPKFRARDHL